jgi:FkbM family methyltransferase
MTAARDFTRAPSVSAQDGPVPARLPTLVYRALVATARLRGRRGTGRIWQRGWDWACERWDGPVTARLHGHRSVMNFGYLYPIFARQYPTYNVPLVDAVNDAADRAGRPVVVVDVGAAIGDTVLLLKERCGPALRGVVCVDGDPEFLQYLTCNLGDDPTVEIHAAMISRGEATAPVLVRTHRGTASAIGDLLTAADSLDATLAGSALAAVGVDVLKSDVDGFDGAVIAGATDLIERCQPVVVFEWHPVLYERAHNDPAEPFDVLGTLGYDDFRWFDRTGTPDGVMVGIDPLELQRRAELSRAVPDQDVHWDVVARVSRG